jgi:hypothetical protein
VNGGLLGEAEWLCLIPLIADPAWLALHTRKIRVLAVVERERGGDRYGSGKRDDAERTAEIHDTLPEIDFLSFNAIDSTKGVLSSHPPESDTITPSLPLRWICSSRRPTRVTFHPCARETPVFVSVPRFAIRKPLHVMNVPSRQVKKPQSSRAVPPNLRTFLVGRLLHAALPRPGFSA